MQIINDFNTSVAKSLSEIYPKWRELDGLILCGSHTPLNVEQMIGMIEDARVNNIPVYAECFGHQLSCIEWARNVMGIEDATSEEFSKTGTFVVKKRSEMKVGLHDGESWWSNYEVIPEVEQNFQKNKPANMFTAAFHPSYQSSKDAPHPLLVSFLNYAKAMRER